MFYAFELDLQIFPGEAAWVFEDCRIHRKSARRQIIASENKIESCFNLSKMFKTTFSSGNFFHCLELQNRVLFQNTFGLDKKMSYSAKFSTGKTLKILTGLKFYFVIFVDFSKLF